jgi:hypothetical protein
LPRGSKPGERRGGRKKGVPNKLTTSAKEAYKIVFENLGGTDAFTDWARLNQTEFYKLHAKTIPVEVNGGDKPIEHRVTVGFE